MKSVLDSQSIELACPNCARKFTETIGKLKTNPRLTCRGCGGAISIHADDLRREIAKVDKALADLGRSVRRLGK